MSNLSNRRTRLLLSPFLDKYIQAMIEREGVFCCGIANAYWLSSFKTDVQTFIAR